MFEKLFNEWIEEEKEEVAGADQPFEIHLITGEEVDEAIDNILDPIKKESDRINAIPAFRLLKVEE